MYVDPDRRRVGIGRKLLQFAEDQCRADNVHRLDLSTSETQPEALALYRNSGFEAVREEVAEAANNKTIGAGVRRYYFKKDI
jgi:ribosomal protein S18 acetylase RimI-like enzyme